MIVKPGDVWRNNNHGDIVVVYDISGEGIRAAGHWDGEHAWILQRPIPEVHFVAGHTYLDHDEERLWICFCGKATVKQGGHDIDGRHVWPSGMGKKTCCACGSWTRAFDETPKRREARAAWRATWARLAKNADV